MRIGILQVDAVRSELQAEFGDYPAMFEDLLQRAEPALDVAVYDVQHGEYPPALEACDGYLITGSRDSVYDQLPWLPPLVRFVGLLRERHIPLVGVCFGHQLIAHFFGGRVGPASAGWAVGVHGVKILRQAPWMEPPGTHLSLLSSHKDQVLELPADALLYATSSFCPNAGFTVADHTMTIQGHPEFCPDYAGRLLEVRRELLGEPAYANGRASLSQPTAEAQMARWFIEFYRRAAAARRAA